MILLEGVRNDPYLDTNMNSIPTIGIGFNLRDPGIRNAVFNRFGIEDAEHRRGLTTIINDLTLSQAALRTELNTRMAELNRQDPDIRPTFAFTGAAEQRTIYRHVIRTYEGRVDEWLRDGNIQGLGASKERAVLVSLSYNGVLTKSPSLRRALAEGNRAQAWYEIRYNLNSR